MTTGEKIKRIRQHRGMTQKELGDAVGLTANSIAQYEMGYRVPKATLLEKMVEAFNVSRECLLEENGMAVAMLEQLFWLDEEMPDIIKLAKTCRSSAGCNTHSAFPCSMTITTIGPHARLSPCGLTLQFWMMFCAIGPRCRGHCGMGNCQESSILSGRSDGRRSKVFLSNR